MVTNNPKISFLFPYRWMKEDKEFMGVNFVRQITAAVGKDSIEELENILAYRIIIGVISHKPVNIPVSKEKIQRDLKKLFPNARCLSIDSEFIQAKSKTVLPHCDFRIFF